MKCPHCGGTDLQVLATRIDRDDLFRRRRRCKSCGERFSTLEIPVEDWGRRPIPLAPAHPIPEGDE